MIELGFATVLSESLPWSLSSVAGGCLRDCPFDAELRSLPRLAFFFSLPGSGIRALTRKILGICMWLLQSASMSTLA